MRSPIFIVSAVDSREEHHPLLAFADKQKAESYMNMRKDYDSTFPRYKKSMTREEYRSMLQAWYSAHPDPKNFGDAADGFSITELVLVS